MSLLTEVLIVGGVALNLVGAAVLSHAHNAESIAEIRAEKSAVGENDAIATHAQLLAEKRFGFFALTFGLTMYVAGLALSSPEGTGPMSALAAGVVAAGFIAALLWTRIVGGRSGIRPPGRRRISTGKSSPSSKPYSGEGTAGALCPPKRLLAVSRPPTARTCSVAFANPKTGMLL